MKKLLMVALVLVLVTALVILKYEHAPTVTIPSIPQTTPVPSEQSVVEAYIRSADIAQITGVAPVLGGTWYLTEVTVDPVLDMVTIAYEDGHIAGAGTVSYQYDQTTRTVSVNGFTKKK